MSSPRLVRSCLVHAALAVLVLCLGAAAPVAHAQSPHAGGPGGAPADDPGQPSEPTVTWDESPDALIVRYEQGFGEVAGSHRITLEVWGDGRTLVTRPPFIRGSERAEMRLTHAAMEELLLELGEHGVFSFDERTARAELAQARREAAQAAREGRGLLWHRSDPPPTVLELNVEHYDSGQPGKAPVRDVSQRIPWIGLHGDAEFHPGVAPVAGLHAAQGRLRALVDSPSLR